MKRFCFLAVLVFTASMSFSALEARDGDYPFAGVVPWDRKSERQEYERLLIGAGFTIRFFPLVQAKGSPRLAEKQQCILVEKGGALFGYGIIFENFLLPAVAENKERGDKRKIEVYLAEVLYDTAGRYIFLVSYRFRQSVPERSIFHINKPLGKGYELDSASRRLAETLLKLPETCRF